MARLQHAALTFPPGADDAVRAFYGGVLGLAEMPVPPEVPRGRGWIWFATDDPGVELHFVPADPPPDPTRMHHVCLEVDELAPVLAALAGAGHDARPAGTPIAGRERVFCRDPFGNLIELAAISG